MLTESDVQSIVEGEPRYLSKSLGEIGTIMMAETPGLWALAPFNNTHIDFAQSRLFETKDDAVNAWNPEQEVLVRLVPIMQED